MGQIGHYAPGELEYLVAHDNVVLQEIQDFSWDYSIAKEPGGSGLGSLHNTYHKRTAAMEGKFSFTRNMLSYADKGTLFDKLLAGAGIIVTEAIALSATTWTPGQTPWSILQIKMTTSGTILKETTDYTVNWATGVVTFNTALVEAATGMYVSGDSDWIGVNSIENTGIEDDITNIWSALATATVTRVAAAAYVGSYGLRVAIAAQNDGAQYDPNIAVVPGRTYRFSFWAKAASAADDITVYWTDGAGSVAMTPVGTAAVLATSWKLHEFTFTPDQATILNLQFKVTDAGAAAQNVDLDEFFLRENAPTVDVMRAGLNRGFEFDIIARRTLDGVNVATFRQCEVYDGGRASGNAYTEKINGQFLRLDVLDV